MNKHHFVFKIKYKRYYLEWVLLNENIHQFYNQNTNKNWLPLPISVEKMYPLFTTGLKNLDYYNRRFELLDT